MKLFCYRKSISLFKEIFVFADGYVAVDHINWKYKSLWWFTHEPLAKPDLSMIPSCTHTQDYSNSVDTRIAAMTAHCSLPRKTGTTCFFSQCLARPWQDRGVGESEGKASTCDRGPSPDWQQQGQIGGGQRQLCLTHKLAHSFGLHLQYRSMIIWDIVLQPSLE